MTDSSPTPPNRQDPQPDPADDADEPAFEWMTPKSAERRPAGASDRAEAPGADGRGRDTPGADTRGSDTPGADTRGSDTPGADTPRAGSTREPLSRADRKAAEAAAAPAPDREGSAVFSEPLPTSALQIRPPEAEVQRRNAEREHALNAKPVAPRVMQVLLAVCFPVILLVLAVRAVASPLFLWVEYNRPGFPGDGYGFSTDDRMTYGSYAVDYLSNWAGPRYLGELVHRNGDRLFEDGEVSHMADVKIVILSAFGAGVLLILLSLIAVIYLRRRSPGGVRRGLFAGSIVTLVIIISLAVLAVLGWEQFFAQFHSVFFASGTWTFSLQDTLIRLFPAQFWVDGGIVIAGLVLIASLVTLILTWPTRKRRGLPKRGAAKEDPADETAADAAPVGEHDADAASAGEHDAEARAADEHAADVRTVDPAPAGAAPAGAAPAKRSLFRRNKKAAKTDAAAAAERPGTAEAGAGTGTPDPGAPEPGAHDTPVRGRSSTV